jgi:phosphatidylglycerophosphatase A
MQQINNTDELLAFIKREDVTAKQGTQIVCAALNVFSCYDKTKPELIKLTDYFIKNFCKTDAAKYPIFLEQLHFDFNITDIYNSGN